MTMAIYVPQYVTDRMLLYDDELQNEISCLSATLRSDRTAIRGAGGVGCNRAPETTLVNERECDFRKY